MKSFLRSVLGATLCCLAVAAQSSCLASIQNGSFESSDPGLDGGAGRQIFVSGTHNTSITDWTLTGKGDVYLHFSPAIGSAIGENFNSAQNGNVYLDLSGGYGGGVDGYHATIFQDFATVPTHTYEVKFWIGAAFDTEAPTINVKIDGTGSFVDELLEPNDPNPEPNPSIDWKLIKYSFVADSLFTRLSFVDVSEFDDNTSFIDSVSVNDLGIAPVPEPMTVVVWGGLAACGAAVAWSTKRRKAA